MSWNRIKYEQCAYDLRMNRSTQPGDYRLYASYAENCDQCISMDGPGGSKADVSLARDNNDLTFTNMADVESQLSWRRQKLTECNDPIDKLDDKKLRHKPSCTNKLISEDTRFTNPIDNYRGMSLTPYMVSPYLPSNPQCVIQDIDEKVGLNSRLYMKDNYKIGEQKQFDDGNALPQAVSENTFPSYVPGEMQSLPNNQVKTPVF